MRDACLSPLWKRLPLRLQSRRKPRQRYSRPSCPLNPRIPPNRRTGRSLQLGEATLIAQLADTEAPQALIQPLEAGPLDIAVSDHGGFEKVGRLPEALPQNDAQITAVSGDILLYQGIPSFSSMEKIHGITPV